MPNSTVSALTALTGANVVVGDDVLYIVDLSAGTSGSKKILVSELFNVAKITTSLTAGQGPTIAAGTAADNTPRALSISQTWTDGTSSNIGIVGNFDMGATGTATGKLLSLQAGAAGTTEVLSVSQAGLVLSLDSIISGAGSVLGFTGRSALTSEADGVVMLSNNAQSDFGRLQFGGTTLSFPALKRSSAELQARLGDDSAYANVDVLGLKRAGIVTISGTAPTLASGGCTTPTAVTSNGTAAFSIGVGTSCSGSQPLVFTLPAATTGWQCNARNTSNAATSAAAQSSAVSTTSVTITSYSRTTGLAQAWTDSDVVAVSCLAY